MPGMMNMDQMQKHMQNMGNIMEQAHKTNDMKKHNALMSEHMNEMRSMMSQMQGSMGKDVKGHVMSDGKRMKDPQDVAMMKRQNMMEQRLNMMQGVMEKMMDQQSMMLKQQSAMEK